MLGDRPVDRSIRLIQLPVSYPRRWGEKSCSACSLVVVHVITCMENNLCPTVLPTYANLLDPP